MMNKARRSKVGASAWGEMPWHLPDRSCDTLSSGRHSVTSRRVQSRSLWSIAACRSAVLPAAPRLHSPWHHEDHPGHPVSARRHLGRSRRELLDLLGARDRDRSLSVRGRERRRDGADLAARADGSDLARVPPRGPAGPPLRLPGAWALRARTWPIASTRRSSCSIPMPRPSTARCDGAMRSSATRSAEARPISVATTVTARPACPNPWSSIRHSPGAMTGHRAPRLAERPDALPRTPALRRCHRGGRSPRGADHRRHVPAVRERSPRAARLQAARAATVAGLGTGPGHADDRSGAGAPPVSGR